MSPRPLVFYLLAIYKDWSKVEKKVRTTNIIVGDGRCAVPFFAYCVNMKIDALAKKQPVIPRPVRTPVVGIRIPYALHENVLPTQGETDRHVAALNATAAYHDSLICRLVPFGAMTVVFYTLPFLFLNGTPYTLATPQSAVGRQLP